MLVVNYLFRKRIKWRIKQFDIWLTHVRPVLNVLIVCIFLWFSAVPEDGFFEKPVHAAYWEAALVQTVLPTDCSLPLPPTLQGAVRLRHWRTHNGYSLNTTTQSHCTQSTQSIYQYVLKLHLFTFINCIIVILKQKLMLQGCI